MQQKWSQKALHRLIVTSATYRQDAAATPALIEKDPYNRLLARGPRFRMEAEMVRDAALAASGLLSPARSAGRASSRRSPTASGTIPYSDDEVGHQRGRGPVSPRALHVHPADVALSELHDVRRDEPRVLHGPARAHQHAAAGADVLNDEAFFEAARALAARAAGRHDRLGPRHGAHGNAAEP